MSQLQSELDYNFQNFPRRMQKELRANQSLINLSSVNSTNTSFCSRNEGHQMIVRRKVTAQPINDRKRRIGTDSQALAMRYIPLTRMNTQENSISLSVSRENSKENLHSQPNGLCLKKFQRHSERVFHQYLLPKSEPEPEICHSPACLQEKNALKQNNERLNSKYTRLQQENQKLLGIIQEG